MTVIGWATLAFLRESPIFWTNEHENPIRWNATQVRLQSDADQTWSTWPYCSQKANDQWWRKVSQKTKKAYYIRCSPKFQCAQVSQPHRQVKDGKKIGQSGYPQAISLTEICIRTGFVPWKWGQSLHLLNGARVRYEIFILWRPTKFPYIYIYIYI